MIGASVASPGARRQGGGARRAARRGRLRRRLRRPRRRHGRRRPRGEGGGRRLHRHHARGRPQPRRPDLTYSVCSAMGYARNLSVVASGDVVIAVGGAWGTLSEIALARNLGRTVVLLDSWTVRPPGRATRASPTASCGRARPPRPSRSPWARPDADGGPLTLRARAERQPRTASAMSTVATFPSEPGASHVAIVGRRRRRSCRRRRTMTGAEVSSVTSSTPPLVKAKLSPRESTALACAPTPWSC